MKFLSTLIALIVNIDPNKRLKYVILKSAIHESLKIPTIRYTIKNMTKAKNLTLIRDQDEDNNIKNSNPNEM